MTKLPLILQVKRGSMDDGPGIRTTVFFKGCPLACAWCHNPESISSAPEILWDSNRCLGEVCQDCLSVCRMPQQGAACLLCGDCANNCPTLARQMAGRIIPIDELCDIVLADRHFYDASGGGVTLSGGEPTMHHDYIVHLLTLLKQEGIATAIQTCGYFHTERFCNELLPMLDLVYFDLKLADSDQHRQYTGLDNDLIMRNLAVLAIRSPERLVVRAPLIPGITATEENLGAIADILRDLNIAKWELLPFNPGGIGKRKRLGDACAKEIDSRPMSRSEEDLCREFFANACLPTDYTNKRSQSCRSISITP